MRVRESHAQKRSFVFVSHANADKKAICHIVEALIAADIKVWLDKPAEMGFRKHEIESWFIDLRGGRGWKEQIHEALDTATCVLAVATGNFWKRYHSGGVLGGDISVVQEEVRIGRSKLVLCRGDETAFDGLPDDLATQEMEDARAVSHDPTLEQERLARLVETVKRMMGDVMERRIGAPQAARDPFEPYLIDRTSQELAARKVLDRAAGGGVHPMFVKGPKNECVDRFRERLRLHTSRDVLDGATWTEALVDWPKADAAYFSEAYGDSLASALKVAPRRLHDHLGTLRQALLAPMSVLDMTEWDKEQPARVQAWLAFWKQAQQRLPHLRAAPLLAVELLPSRHANWKTFPGERHRGVDARRIHREVANVGKQADKMTGLAPLTQLDILAPVSSADASNWLRKVAGEVADAERDRFEGAVAKAFRQGRRTVRRLTLADFARAMRPLYNEG